MKQAATRGALAAAALFALFGAPSGADAQRSAVSDLWREWATLEEQWRAEQAERERLRRRLNRLRAARAEREKEAARP